MPRMVKGGGVVNALPDAKNSLAPTSTSNDFLQLLQFFFSSRSPPLSIDLHQTALQDPTKIE